jgi:hypothetical protein
MRTRAGPASGTAREVATILHKRRRSFRAKAHMGQRVALNDAQGRFEGPSEVSSATPWPYSDLAEWASTPRARNFAMYRPYRPRRP